MNKQIYSCWIGIMSVLSVCTNTWAQMKVGDHPTSIQAASILELESKNKGLLLSRLSDTVLINQQNPSDGMIFFLQHNLKKALMIRRNNQWEEVLTNKGSKQPTTYETVTEARHGQVLFNTPKPISIGATIQVFRNGTNIKFTQASNVAIRIEPEATCYAGDEIKIIQTF